MFFKVIAGKIRLVIDKWKIRQPKTNSKPCPRFKTKRFLKKLWTKIYELIVVT